MDALERTVPSSLSHDYHTSAALFLGPRAEGIEFLYRSIASVLGHHQALYLQLHKSGDPSLDASTQNSDAFHQVRSRLKSRLEDLVSTMHKGSTPIFSPRYLGHVVCNPSLPSLLGYFAALLLNQNNCAPSLSPVTGDLEYVTGQQLCGMIGYNTNSKDLNRPLAWGHLPCGGTIANLEAVLACRNLKFYPLSIREAMREGQPLSFARETFHVTTCSGQRRLLKNISTWESMNLDVSTILDIPTRLLEEYHLRKETLEAATNPFSVQSLGKDTFERRWGIKTTPKFIVASTRHYSWPKAVAFAGIGSSNIIPVNVDINARMSIPHLREILEECLRSHQAVYSVVASVGTTQEGAVDPIHEIIQLRQEFTRRGLAFTIHVDAAWGAYFSTMIPRNPTSLRKGELRLAQNVERQMLCLKDVDSVTIDPHKSGYAPYPAGGLCYRDGRMRYLLTWSAPYIDEGYGDQIGAYGVEGSKPGAAAAAVWFAHEVIGLDEFGYGALHRRALFGGRILSCHLATMSDEHTPFVVVPFNRLPSEQGSTLPVSVELDKQFIRRRILGVSEEQIASDTEAMDFLNDIGSELNINVFVCNFRLPNGSINKDISLANQLNRRVSERPSAVDHGSPFFVASTMLAQKDYGECLTAFKQRALLEGDGNLFVLRSTVMSPFSTRMDFLQNLRCKLVQVLEEEVKMLLANSGALIVKL